MMAIGDNEWRQGGDEREELSVWCQQPWGASNKRMVGCQCERGENR